MLDIIYTRSAWSSDAISTISELSLAMTFSRLILFLFSSVSLSRISVLDRYRLLHLGFSAPDDSRLLLILPSWCFAWTQFTQLSPCVLFVRTRQLDENTLASDASSSSRRSRTSCLIYKSGEIGVSAGKSNLKPRQKLDFSTKFKTNLTFSISLPFFNADSKPGKSHRFIVRSWDVTTDRRQFILFYLFYFLPFFFLFCFYLHICVLVRTSGHMIVMWPENTW